MIGGSIGFGNPSRHSISEGQPLFERIENNDIPEVQESKEEHEALKVRVTELERIIVDLERRLEVQGKQYVSLEDEFMHMERDWKKKLNVMNEEIEEWKKKCYQQEQKGDKLREHLSRTERELYGVFQRKYEMMRGANAFGSRPQHGTRDRDDGGSHTMSASPDEILNTPKVQALTDPKQRKAILSLCDFFGIDI